MADLFDKLENLKVKQPRLKWVYHSLEIVLVFGMIIAFFLVVIIVWNTLGKWLGWNNV
jgi:hypothetical protein